MPTKRERTLKAFGAQLAQLRRGTEMTQEQLAERAGMHPNYVGDLERGQRNPTLITLLSLAKALDTSVAELVRPVDPRN
jgi:transcriptional regulator with XRE-family HTH domain